MAFDSAVLAAVADELRPRLLQARINKVHQTDSHTLVLRWHGRADSGRLLLCAHPLYARLQQTEVTRDNPDKAPLFAMVLRKWLEGARINDITVTPGERIVALELCGLDSLGDPAPLRLILEIMGKHSNIILTDGAGTIIDGIRRYGSSLSRWREVLPGRPYLAPPPLGKLALPPEAEQLAAALYDAEEKSVAPRLQQSVAGLSPLLAQHICLSANVDPDLSCGQLGAGQLDRLLEQLSALARQVERGDWQPTLRKKQGRYVDFAALPPLAWPENEREAVPSMNQALDMFYGRQEKEQQFLSVRHDLLKQLNRHLTRLEKKIEIQQNDLARCESAEQYKAEGDLLAANLWRLEKGQDSIDLPSFYQPEQLVTVALDPSLTPQENVQLRYRRYAKARKSRDGVSAQLSANKEELAYAASIRQSLLFAESEEELAEPKRELLAAGYIAPEKRPKGGRPRDKEGGKTPALPPRSYTTEQGFTVLIGRNNRQNDRLSLKQAEPSDVWLHAHQIPGSHVIIRALGRPVPEESLLQAASWAAWFSQGREAERVDVDILPASRLRKPSGSRPGYVIYTGQRTVRVKPIDPENI